VDENCIHLPQNLVFRRVLDITFFAMTAPSSPNHRCGRVFPTTMRSCPIICPIDLASPPDTKRWVPRRKAMIVYAVLSGAMSLEEVCRCYELSVE
jgi:hypothetical protein